VLRLNGRELLFGEAERLFAEIISLSDCGGEEKDGDRLVIHRVNPLRQNEEARFQQRTGLFSTLLGQDYNPAQQHIVERSYEST